MLWFENNFFFVEKFFIVHTQHLLPGAGVGLEQNELSNLSLFSSSFMFIMFATSFLVNPLAFLQHNSAPGKDEMSNRKKASDFNIFAFQIEAGAKIKVWTMSIQHQTYVLHFILHCKQEETEFYY